MTRKEFFEQRKKADFLKCHGPTVCPPGEAQGSRQTTLTVRPQHRNRRANTTKTGIAARMVQHCTDEAHDPQPVTLRRLRKA